MLNLQQEDFPVVEKSHVTASYHFLINTAAEISFTGLLPLKTYNEATAYQLLSRVCWKIEIQRTHLTT